ncbi:MAG: hypothetical protein AAGA66_13825 [Bacteroidota bacterium]
MKTNSPTRTLGIASSMILFFLGFASSAQPFTIITTSDSLDTEINLFTNLYLNTGKGNVTITDIQKIIINEDIPNEKLQKLNLYRIPLEFSRVDNGTKISYPVSGNFYLDDNKKIYYEKIFETNLSESILRDRLLQKFEKLKFKEENYVIDHEALGYTPAVSPFFILGATHSFKTFIQIKENRYRVIAYDFIVVDLLDSESDDQNLFPLASLIFRRNGSMRNPIANKTGLECFSESLDQYFNTTVLDKILAEDW